MDRVPHQVTRKPSIPTGASHRDDGHETLPCLRGDVVILLIGPVAQPMCCSLWPLLYISREVLRIRSLKR